jgi:hypothetical protein
MELTISATVDSPLSQRILINLNSAGVSVMDLFGGIELGYSLGGRIHPLLDN